MTIKVVETITDNNGTRNVELFELDYIPREGERFEIGGKHYNVQMIIHRRPLFGEYVDTGIIELDQSVIDIVDDEW